MPRSGPVILAGNHVGLMEIVMMAVLPPFHMEFLGSGDIPLDPKFAWIARLYGIIPVSRGNLDRRAIYKAVNVLERKGVVAVFPEGGIWSPGAMPARLGIALVSGLAKAPVLPIGFGGVHGALKKALRFQRPHLSMNIGELIPPVEIDRPGLSRKAALEQGAQRILAEIMALIPETTMTEESAFDESFDLEIHMDPPVGENKLFQIVPEHLHTPLSRVLLHPVIMDIFNRNLALPVDALLHLKEIRDPGRIARALHSVLSYLETNPGFLTYRFGMEDGVRMKQGLSALHELANTASREGRRIHIRPVRILSDRKSGERLLQDQVEKMSQY